MEKDMMWDMEVPIFKNKIILKQLSIAIGIPFGILIIFMFIVKAYYGVLLVGVTLILTVLFVMIFFNGTYDVTFVINQKGILCKTQQKQRKKVKTLSIITVLAGFISNNPTVAGAGMLANSSANVFIPWKGVRKVKYLENQKYIMISAGFGENIAVFCTEDNYNQVKYLFIQRFNKNG